MKKTIRLQLIFISILCIYSTSNNLNAQKIKWGTINKSTFFTSQFSPVILGEDDANFYTYAKHGGTSVYALEGYNKTTGKQIYTIEFNAGKKDRRVDLEKAVFIKDKIVVFIAEYSNKNNKQEFYAKIYNAKTGKIANDRFDLFFEITDENYFNSGRFDAYLSPDRLKVLINYYAFNSEKNKFYDKFILFNEDLKEIVRRENTYDNEHGDGSSHYTLDNNGNLYFLKPGSKMFEKFIVSYDVENDYEKWEEQIQTQNLDMDAGSIVTDLNLKINLNNELVVYGVYCKTNNATYSKGPKGAFDGYVYIRIDKNSKEIIQEKLILLEDDLIAEVKANMGKHEMYFDLDILNLNNGESVLMSQFSLKLPNGSKSKVRYCDLVVTKLKSTGEKDWSLRIPKKQQYTASNLQLPWYHKPFYKYTFFADDNNLYLLFNDHQKNDFTIKNTLELKSMNNPSSSKISIYSVDIISGKYSTSSLNGNQENGVAMMAPLCYQKVQGSGAYVFGKDGKKYIYGIFKK